MSIEKAETYRNLWQRWFDEVWANRNAEAIAELTAEDIEFFPAPGGPSIGQKEFMELHRKVLERFSRVEARVLDPVAMDDWICVRTELVMVKAGSEEEIRLTGLQRGLVRNGRFAKVWDSWDWLPGLVKEEKVSADAVTSFLTGP